MTAVVTLTTMELWSGAIVGLARRLSSIQKGIDNKKHAEQSDWSIDIDGACAEIAVAKYRGLYWTPTNGTFKLPDLGDLQIRSTSHLSGHLIVRPNDTKNERFILVRTAPPSFTICGWYWASDAKADRYWRQDSWWVPQSDLHDIAQIETHKAA